MDPDCKSIPLAYWLDHCCWLVSVLDLRTSKQLVVGGDKLAKVRGNQLTRDSSQFDEPKSQDILTASVYALMNDLCIVQTVYFVSILEKKKNQGQGQKFRL